MAYTAAKSRPSYTFDALLQLKDAGLVAADGAAQVASANKILDIGTGYFEGTVVIDATAIEIDTNNESYRICVQGSNSPTFASGITNLAILELGAKGGAIGNSTVDVDDTAGRYHVDFCNERNNTYYRYVRLYTDVAGTIATGINFTAFIAIDR